MKSIKRFIKLCLYLITFGVLLFGSYASFIKSSKKEFTIIDSPIQGKKILKTGEWGLYPENIIPHFIKIQHVGSQISDSTDLKIPLPYSKLLKNWDDFTIEIHYSFDYTWNDKNIQELYYKSPEKILEKIKKNINSKVKETLLNAVKKNLTLKTDIKEELKGISDNNIKIKILLLQIPDLEQYATLKTEIKKTLADKENTSKKIFQALDSMQKDLEVKNRKKRLNSVLDFSIKASTKIKKAKVDTQTSLNILNYLLDYKK